MSKDFSLVVSNFAESDRRTRKPTGKQVPWLKLPDGCKMPGLSRGICPRVVLAILDNADDCRDIAERAIDIAEHYSAAAVARELVAVGKLFPCWATDNGAVVQCDDMETGRRLSAAGELFMAYDQSGGWKTAVEFGIVAPQPPAPPAPPKVPQPPAAPKAPTAPVAPVVKPAAAAAVKPGGLSDKASQALRSVVRK